MDRVKIVRAIGKGIKSKVAVYTEIPQVGVREIFCVNSLSAITPSNSVFRSYKDWAINVKCRHMWYQWENSLNDNFLSIILAHFDTMLIIFVASSPHYLLIKRDYCSKESDIYSPTCDKLNSEKTDSNYENFPNCSLKKEIFNESLMKSTNRFEGTVLQLFEKPWIIT